MKRKSSSLKSSFMNTQKDRRGKMKKKPKGKITVTSIPKDLLDTLPEDTDTMTIEEINRFASEVFRKCFRYEGDTVDVSKLPKDFDEDELTYDPDTVVEWD